jgi:Icc-related predicted phosphoesterase
MRIAIIGDPHFEVLSEANTQSSFIKLDASGNFINQSVTENPWIGLRELISESGKNIDALICAGDLTVKANGAGLKKAWEELLALGSQIGAIHTISATGNHDVLSRTNNDIRANPVRGMSETKGVFEPLKLLKPTYPLVEHGQNKLIEHKDIRARYFGNGLALLEAETYRIIILNSCCEHGPDSWMHERGAFPDSAHEAIIDELNNKNTDKINLLVCHHPPNSHSDEESGSYDFIEKGDRLIQALENHGSWMIIHGHKHQGKISYAQGSLTAPTIFSAASLGFHIEGAPHKQKNEFYCLEIELDQNQSLRGHVEAWEWHFGIGWKVISDQSKAIFNGCGFGNRSANINSLATDISSKPLPYGYKDLLNYMPEFKYLTPKDMGQLKKRLESNHNITIETDQSGRWEKFMRTL